jgi:putative N6-adenine-specific DNA methylase
MCGSGTLAIEHALRARRIAPGLGRAFGFQRWPMYRGAPQSAWDRMKAEARAEVLPAAPAPIVARDSHPKAILAAQRNVVAAGVAADVAIEQADARDLAPSVEAGAIVSNPPYGERLGGGREGASAAEARVSDKKLAGFYRGLSAMIERHHGWTAVLLSGNPLLERAIPLRPEVDHRLWNGPLETHLLKYRVP